MTIGKWASRSLLLFFSAFPLSGHASSLIDNVNGLAIDADNRLLSFDGLLIDDDGKVEKLLKHGDKRPEKLKFRLDAKGRTLVPGMIDAHAHVMSYGFSLLTLDLSETTSLADAQAKIADYVRANAGRKWIMGRGWNQEKWALGRFPTAAELDSATGDIPVWLESADGHAGWANSAAMRAAGVNATTKSPAGGRIETLTGKPSGIFVDNAMGLITKFLPVPAAKDRDLALELAQRKLLLFGVTGVADIGTTIEDWQAYRRAGDSGRLRVRIMGYAANIEQMTLIAGPEPTPWLYDDHLRTGGVRIDLDGSLGSHGAWLKQDYADATGQKGIPLIGGTQLRNQMSRAAMDGFQIASRAIGDRANAEILDAIDELAATYKGDRRWRVEQAQIVDPVDVPRFAQHDTVVSMQPMQASTGWKMTTVRVGEARSKGAYVWRAMIDNRVPLAFGSDAPAESPNPFPAIAAAVSREDARAEPAGGWVPEQRIRLEEALAAYTAGAAYAGYAEKRFGMLAPGQQADFLLLDRDISSVSPAAIRETQVLETWVGGKRIFAK